MSIQHKIDNLPRLPGVYMFKDKSGRILYVGKAKSLRPRVQSYFRAGTELEDLKKQMVTKIASLDIITTDNEIEALVLEANLIRKHQPPYNVVLRDDKYYLFIKVTNDDWPRVYPVRRLTRGGRHFGPYSSAQSVRATLRLLRRIFPFRGEKDEDREFIFPHPLFRNNNQETNQAGSVDATQYKQNIENIINFLSGRRDQIIKTLEQGMQTAARAGRFEQAAIWRDQLRAVQRLEGTQKVFLAKKESFDVVSLARQKNVSAVNVFQIRQGKLLSKNTFLLKHHALVSPADTLRQFILQYYKVAQDIPRVILVPENLPDGMALAAWISRQNPPKFAVPLRGKKRQLMHMGETNAKQLLSEQEAVWESEQRGRQAHRQLMLALKLNPQTVHRIETYDISNIQGTLATASMVVFSDGQKQPKHYRKFRIKMQNTPNDFAMLQETLQRRFAANNRDWPQPDLVVIDGGKGQLSAARKIMSSLGINIPVISIAKREEEIFYLTGMGYEALRLSYDSPALFLIQRMRDEAHRFTVTYHRLLREKQQKKSLLDEVPGIGPKSKKALLRRFGSLKGIRQASREEIEQIIGAAKTAALMEYL